MKPEKREIFKYSRNYLTEARKKDALSSDKNYKAPPSKIKAPETSTTDPLKSITRRNVEQILDTYGSGFITKHLDDSHYDALSKMSTEQLRDTAHEFKSVWVASNFPGLRGSYFNKEANKDLTAWENVENPDLGMQYISKALTKEGFKHGKDYSILSNALESGTHTNDPSTDIHGKLLALHAGIPLSIQNPVFEEVPEYQMQFKYKRPNQTGRRHENDQNPRIKAKKGEIDRYKEEHMNNPEIPAVNRIVTNAGGFGERVAAGVGKGGPAVSPETPEEEIKRHPVLVYADIIRDKTNRAFAPETDIANPQYVRELESKDSLKISQRKYGDHVTPRLVQSQEELGVTKTEDLQPHEKAVRKALNITRAKEALPEADYLDRSNPEKAADAFALSQENITPRKLDVQFTPPSWWKGDREPRKRKTIS